MEQHVAVVERAQAILASDDYAAERIMPSDMAFSAGGSLADKVAVATFALLSIMQIVGFVAMV